MNSSFLKMLKIDNNQLLSREHLKNVTGGNEVSSTLDGDSVAGCTASCGDGTVVTCSGPNCTATDNVGCTDDFGGKSCSV